MAMRTGTFERVARRLLPSLAVLAIAGGAAAGPVVLSSGQIARAGIVVETLLPARFAPSIPALGVVLDPAPLIRLHGSIAEADATVAGAKAKVLLEQQQMVQAKALYRRGQIISMSDYQKAAEDLAAHQAALTVARVKRAALLAEAGARWGAAMAGVLRSGGEPLPQLAAGEAILVGLSLPPGTGLADPPRRVEAKAAGVALRPHADRSGAGHARRLSGAELPISGGGAGRQRRSAPRFRRRCRSVRGENGVVVPRSAVVWQGGGAVVYRAAAGRRFEPVAIATGSPAAAGYFVADGLSPGDRVVIRGAALLSNGGANTGPADRDD